MINEIPEEMMPEMFVVPITVPPVTYAKVIIQGDNVTIEPRLKTNADRIRSMADEEMAEWFAGHDSGLVANVLNNDYVEPTKDGWLEWLQQECSP